MTRSLPFLHDLNWVKCQVLWLWIPSKDMTSPNLFNAFFFFFVCVLQLTHAESLFLRDRGNERRSKIYRGNELQSCGVLWFIRYAQSCVICIRQTFIWVTTTQRACWAAPKHISYVELSDFDVLAHLVECAQTNWLRLLCPSSSKKKKKGGLDLRGHEVTHYLDEESAWSPR